MDNYFDPGLRTPYLPSCSSNLLFHPCSPCYHYEDEAIYTQHLHNVFCGSSQGIVATTTTNNVPQNIDNSIQIDPPLVEQKIMSKKKDRHRKINTARGLRDTRIRLSVEVARKLYALKDMLGSNSANKTLEWLLIHSEGDREKLPEGGVFPQMNEDSTLPKVGASSTSDFDVVSADGIEGSILGNTSSKLVLPSTCTSNLNKILGG